MLTFYYRPCLLILTYRFSLLPSVYGDFQLPFSFYGFPFKHIHVQLLISRAVCGSLIG